MKAERIGPGANPGGAVIHIYIDDRLVDTYLSPGGDAVALDDVAGVLSIRAYSGDTGELIGESEEGDLDFPGERE